MRAVQTANACSGGQATSNSIRSGSVIAGAVVEVPVVFSATQPEPAGRVAPDAEEVVLHRAQAVVLQVVDPAGALGALAHQPGVLEQPQVARDRRSADRHRVGQLADRPVTGAEQPQDLAAVGVAERLEGVARCLRHRSPFAVGSRSVATTLP